MAHRGAAWIRQYIRQNRRNPAMRFAARSCEKFLRAYFNEGFYDLARNGEEFALATFAQWSTEPQVVVWDVGAHRGEWACAAHAALPHAQIVGFEIMPATFADLEELSRGRGWLRVECLGLSDHEREVVVHWNPSCDSTSSLQPRIGHALFPDGTQEVTSRVTTGDRYLVSTASTTPDLLKIDVEGHELAVLRGCRSMLAGSARPAMIQFEYGTTYLPGRSTLQQVYDLLIPEGYVIGRLYPNHVAFSPYRYDQETFRMGNYIAVRDRRLEEMLTTGGGG